MHENQNITLFVPLVTQVNAKAIKKRPVSTVIANVKKKYPA